MNWFANVKGNVNAIEAIWVITTQGKLEDACRQFSSLICNLLSISYSTSRCASCIGESARAQWFRHSDGWRSGSSTLGSGTNLISQGTGHRRSPWDSLPSLKQDGSLNDSGYKSTRADSFEQRLDFWNFSLLNIPRTLLRPPSPPDCHNFSWKSN